MKAATLLREQTRIPNQEHPENQMASCTLKSGTGGSPEEPIKISIVDDDENERWQMTRDVDQSPDLERVGSYSSGAEALQEIPSSASEVVLMDVRMPGMSGIEVTKRLKE